MDEDKQPFTAHLEELRTRLIRCLVSVGVGFLLCYYFSPIILKGLMKPLLPALPEEARKLVFISVTERFFTHLKVALLAGVFLAIPVIFHQFWKFVAPGLYDRERQHVFPFVLISTLFFTAGALFCYMVVFPYGFQFLVGSSSWFSNPDLIRPMISIKEYLSTASKMLLGFGLIFELPIVMIFLARVGIITPQQMTQFRKYALVLVFAVAAILTPPDIVTQVLMAGPLILLYEISILGARVFAKKTEEEPEEEDDDDEEDEEDDETVEDPPAD